MSAAKAKRSWQKWLHLLADPEMRLSVELAGVPGHVSLPAGWMTRGQFVRDHLVYLVTEGRIQAIFNGKKVLVSQGGLFWIRPGTAFSLARANTGNLTILRCRLRVEKQKRTVPTPWPWRWWPAGTPCLPWLEWLIQEADQPDSWSQARLRSLTGGLFTELARIDTAGPVSGSGLTANQKQTLAALIAGRKDARATPRELARAVGLSYDYFSRCFKRSYARTPRRWLMEQRIHVAMLRLTESGRRIGEIAQELGYEDLFLFSRQFKAVTGASPLSYRKGCFLPAPAAP